MRAVIAEDSVLLRAGLTRLLGDAGIEVVAAVGNADALLRAVDEVQPDVAIVDVRMPPTHTDEGLRAALVMRRQWPRVAVLVLSQYVEQAYATELLAGENKRDDRLRPIGKRGMLLAVGRWRGFRQSGLCFRGSRVRRRICSRRCLWRRGR